jgi:hypothetical protein
VTAAIHRGGVLIGASSLRERTRVSCTQAPSSQGEAIDRTCRPCGVDAKKALNKSPRFVTYRKTLTTCGAEPSGDDVARNTLQSEVVSRVPDARRSPDAGLRRPADRPGQFPEPLLRAEGGRRRRDPVRGAVGADEARLHGVGELDVENG